MDKLARLKELQNQHNDIAAEIANLKTETGRAQCHKTSSKTKGKAMNYVFLCAECVHTFEAEVEDEGDEQQCPDCGEWCHALYQKGGGSQGQD